MQGDTGSDTGRYVQGVTGGYREIQRDTRSNRGMQGDTGRCREIQGYWGEYRGIQGDTGDTMLSFIHQYTNCE